MAYAQPREKLSFSQLRDSSCVTQLILNTGYGIGLGMFGALSSFTMKYPNLKNKPAGALFRGIAYEWVPGITAGSMVFSLVACAIEANRGVRDEVSSAIGGFAGAFTFGAIKYRSPTAPFIIGLLGALAAGGADAWDRLSPSVEELAPKKDPRYSTLPASGSALATSSIISTGVTTRLLK